MIGYYYKSESDVLFKRVSLEHEQKQNNNNSNIVTNSNNSINNKIYLSSDLFKNNNFTKIF